MCEKNDGADGACARQPASTGHAADLAIAAVIVLALEAAGRLAFGLTEGAEDPLGPALGFPPGDTGAAMGFTAALRAAQAAAAVAFTTMVRRKPPACLGLGAAGAKRSIVAALVLCALLAAGLFAWTFASSRLDGIPGIAATVGRPDFEAGANAAFVLGLLAMILAGPVAEEVFFRGLVFGAVRKPFGAVAAAVVSTCLFAAAHASGPWAFYLAGGAAFAYLRERSGSLWGPIVAHSVGNAVLLLFVLC